MLWINTVFQSPLWLWLLAAIAIPIAIHLIRRSNPQEISFAAAHWLQRYSQSQARRPYVDNKWLLLLRLVLITLLALLLSQPLLQREGYPPQATLLVDPRIEAGEAKQFIHSLEPQRQETDVEILWLSPETASISTPRPQNSDLWKTLSTLAQRPDLRHAYILLMNSANPASHSALKVSPHWQWHSLNERPATQLPFSPRIAVTGDSPAWLQPVIEDWRRYMPKLSLQVLAPGTVPDARQLDWLVYGGSGPLPQAIQEFVSAGGLLISDAGVQAPSHISFTALGGGIDSAQAAPLGRGSWLRYRDNWHSDTFYQHTDLPELLWQQWSKQDWPLQHHSRGSWSGKRPPAIAVADNNIDKTYSERLQPWLIVILLLLLALERLVALSSVSHGGKNTKEARYE